MSPATKCPYTGLDHINCATLDPVLVPGKLYRFRLLLAYAFLLCDQERDDYRIVVPAGTVTDFASVPRLLWWWEPPHGRALCASIVHDHLYQLNGRPCSNGETHDRKSADRVFYEGLLRTGVPKVRAWPMYAALRLFGGFAWRKHGRAKS